MKPAGEVAVHSGQGGSEVALIARTAAEIEAAAQPILVDGDRPRLCA